MTFGLPAPVPERVVRAIPGNAVKLTLAPEDFPFQEIRFMEVENPYVAS